MEHEIVEASQAALKEERGILTQKGIQIIEFSSADTKMYYDLAYAAGWKAITEKAPEHAPKLQKLISK